MLTRDQWERVCVESDAYRTVEGELVEEAVNEPYGPSKLDAVTDRLGPLLERLCSCAEQKIPALVAEVRRLKALLREMAPGRCEIEPGVLLCPWCGAPVHEDEQPQCIAHLRDCLLLRADVAEIIEEEQAKCE